MWTMKTAKDRSGEKYSKLTIIKRFGSDYRRCSTWLCRCDCGNETISSIADLKRGHKKSCGCIKIETATANGKNNKTHGMRNAVEYRIWSNMIERCSNTKRKGSENYSLRGIRVDESWLRFDNFYKDMGDRPSRFHSLDRFNNDDGYSKENCRWATYEEQQRNKRKHYKSSTGVCGVFWKECANKYQVRISVQNTRISLGYFKTIHEAIMARINAEQKFGHGVNGITAW